MSILVAHLIKCITPENENIEEAVLQAGKSIASSNIPKIIRNEFKRIIVKYNFILILILPHSMDNVEVIPHCKSLILHYL